MSKISMKKHCRNKLVDCKRIFHAIYRKCVIPLSEKQVTEDINPNQEIYHLSSITEKKLIAAV